MKTKFIHFGFFVALLSILPAYSATTVKKQSAIQNGTNVRARSSASGLYSQECYDAYYGCMDQFCIMDNQDGGSCACSNKNAEYEKRLDAIKNTLIEADRVMTEEVERVQAGADADIVFTGTREYDEKTGDVAKEHKKSGTDKRRSLLAMWDEGADDDDSVFGSGMDSIADKTGDELHMAADELCREQMDMDTCGKEIGLLKQMYSAQIISDCKGFENSIVKKVASAKQEMNKANAAVRAALKESLDSANKYDRGECMVEYKKCMQGADACGSDWENCVVTIASENMQNKKARSTAGTKVATVTKYGITPSTMEVLESKRYICERVLDSCVSSRQYVWTDFLREAAPTIKFAESKIESKKRQSCLSDISKCIQKACKDDIAGKGKDTMDACLSRPDMARSFCKIEIDPCERMEPQIWSYVKDKLAAMRVDACTNEVRECFTDDMRCGENFSKCIGMDYAYIHEMCPIDKLVVCKKGNPNFSMDDLDSMLMGLYLNIDNAALENCQDLVEEKMLEICGSTTDCNKFATDDTMGTTSLQSQKKNGVYRVTGMISFGAIKMGDASGSVRDGNRVLKPGEIGVADYIENVNTRYRDIDNAAGIISSIEAELNNISGTINRVIDMIEQDPQIQFCVTGRNLKNITGSDVMTQARFPNLLNQVKMQIAMSALRRAQDNYNEKFNNAVTQAVKDASADVAQYMCQMMPVSGGAPVGGIVDSSGELTPPYAISYDVGVGLTNDMLAQGGRGSANTGGSATIDGTAGASKFGEVVNSFTGLGNNKVKISLPGGTRDMWSVFNRETRVCHLCSSTVTKSCKHEYSKGFLGMGSKDDTSCTESEPEEKCEDIQM